MRTVPSSLAARLLDAAEKLGPAGMEDARIDDLTEAAGIPRATLYYYFDGKEGVLAWFLQRWLERVSEVVQGELEGEGTARQRLHRVIASLFELMAENPAMGKELAANLGRATRLPDLAAAIDVAFNEPLRQLLAEGVSDGSLKAVAAEPVVTAIFGAVVVPALWYIVVDESLPTEKTAREVSSLVIGGLATTAATRR